MANINKIDKQAKELIQGLNDEELLAYLDNISKKKVNALGLFSTSEDGSSMNVKEYKRYSNILEDVVTILSEKGSSSADKQIITALMYGASRDLDYTNLLDLFQKQGAEAELISIKLLTEMLYYEYSSIEKDFNYLRFSLNLFYLLYIDSENTDSLELAFNMLIEFSYNNLTCSLNESEKYTAIINLYEQILEKNKQANKLAEEVIESLTNNINLFYKIMEYKEKLKELKANPFEEGNEDRILTFLNLAYADEFESIQQFNEMATEEKDLEFYELLSSSISKETPSYNFETFEIIVPEDPEGSVN